MPTQASISLEELELAFKNFAETHTVCDSGCRHGHIVPDVTDIDPYTEEPHTAHCPACNGSGYVHIQRVLPF